MTATALGIACELRDLGMLVRGGGRFGAAKWMPAATKLRWRFQWRQVNAAGEIIVHNCDASMPRRHGATKTRKQ